MSRSYYPSNSRQSFQQQQQRSTQAFVRVVPVPRLVLLSSSSSSSSTSTLEFTAEMNEATQVLTDNRTELEEFLIQETTKEIFVSGGGKNRVERFQDVKEPSKNYGIWMQKAHEYNETHPSTHIDPSCEEFIAGETSVRFPGVTLYISTLLLMRTNRTDDKKLIELWTIGEKLRPQGLKPMVWLFHQLTRSKDRNNTNDDYFVPSKVVAYSKAFVAPTGDGSGYQVKFLGNFTVQQDFPSTLLKIMPFSLEESQARGSKAIQKTIDKQTKDSIQAIQEAFQQQQHAKNVITTVDKDCVH